MTGITKLVDQSAAGWLKKQKAWEYGIKRTYGIDGQQWHSILDEQNGMCAICQRPASSFKTRLAVDHDHRTGRIRGLLCIYCNRYRVGRHNDPEILRRVVAYLEQGTDYYVPKKVKKKKK